MSEYKKYNSTPLEDKIMEEIKREEIKEVDQTSFRQPPPSPKGWPQEISHDAFHGLAGDIVKAIDPHTEADPVATLISFLTAFGSIIGNEVYIKVGADKHPARLFTVLVGSTAKGRKGTSWGYLKEIFSDFDPTWKKRVQTGLSSGEGVIWSVRDAIEKQEPIKDKDGRIMEYQTIIEDHGIEEKRLFLLETEFASALKATTKDGNNLSAIIRNSWDTGELQIITKHKPAKATNAHIVIMGHITKPELLKYLTSVESANGFGNRFLWICVRRSKLLPEGGNLSSSQIKHLITRLHQAITFSKTIGEMTRSDDATQLWKEIYYQLSEEKPGIIGSMTARSEPCVLRIALIYALLDCSSKIYPVHLRAACAVWRYAEDSVKYIFQDTTGDSLSDEILNKLKQAPSGLTRTGINASFSKHKTSIEIEGALQLLKSLKLADFSFESSGGRPTEKWKAVIDEKKA